MEIVIGVLMGLVYVAPPGPINVETLRRGLAGGVGVALALQLGALVGDLGYALLALRGASLVGAHSPLAVLLGLASTALLLYLGGSSLRAGYRQPATQAAGMATEQPISVFSWRACLLTGATLSLANPYAAAYWLALGSTALQQTHDHPAPFLMGFLLSDLLWVLGFPLLIGWSRTMLGPSFFRWISIACSVGLISFGLALGRAVALL